MPDLFSLQGLANLGKYLSKWRREWQLCLDQLPTRNRDYPIGEMKPIGYIILQHRERQNRLVTAHRRWVDRIPKTYSESVLDEAHSNADNDFDPNLIGHVRNYQSMMALSHEARKPVFELRSADGVIGSHFKVVQEADETYAKLAQEIAKRIGMAFD